MVLKKKDLNLKIFMFSCLLCRQTFDKRSLRDAHSRKVHLDKFKDERRKLHQRDSDRLFKCHLCISTFEDSKNFKKHLSIHYKNNEESPETEQGIFFISS
jgi:uncharacterized C2H2 Zn-finger protein